MTDVVVPGQELDTHHNIALPWYQGGCAVIPIRPGGSKAPFFDWEGYKHTRPSLDDVRLWFEVQYSRAGVAVICGRISGNLELVELEGRSADADSLSKIQAECDLRGVKDIWESLLQHGYTEWSPSGGIHVLYRVPDHEIPGNTKLAMREALFDELNDQELQLLSQNSSRKFWRVLAETRGEGGYVVVAPTGGHCHKSGEPWATVSGEHGVFQQITWSQRMAIHSAIIAALDERPPVPEPAPQPPPTTRLLSDDSRPGDLFNERASWEESWFTSQGWRVSHRSKEETFWVRPGKDVRDGHSASTGYRGDTDCLYIWSSSTDLPTETPLSKFFVFSHYYFNGDMSKAAKALRQQGYTNEGSTTTLALLRALDFEDIEGGQQEVALPVHRGHDLTDTGNGRRMKEFFGGQFRYNTIESKWYVWRGHAWERDDTLEVHRASERNAEMVLEVYQALVEQARGTDGYKAASKELHDAKLIFNQGKIVAAIARFSAQPGIAITPGQFDSNLDLLNLPNGTLNLVTGKLHPHDPDNLITLTFGAEYDPDAGCPKFLRFMADILPSTDIQGYVQRALGYTLLGRPAERAMFLLHGPSGTGKSVLTSVMTRVFGGYGITAPATTFRLKKNDTSVDVHRLRGRRFVTTSEMPEGVLLDEELVKRITGGDMITSRSLYEDYQDWKAQCVVWIATNFLPRVNSDDNAIWRRAKSIPMQTEFGKDGLEEILGYADQLVVERNGILNWLLEGLIAYRERGLDQPEEITADIESYRTDVDAVASFIRDRLDEGILVRVDGAEVKSSVLNGLYTRYCEENRMPVLGARRFANRLRALGFTPAKVGGVAMWTGLQYVPDGWHDFLIAPQLQAAGS